MYSFLVIVSNSDKLSKDLRFLLNFVENISRQKRVIYSIEFKIKLVLEILKGEKTQYDSNYKEHLFKTSE